MELLVITRKRPTEQCATKHIVIDSDIVTPSDKVRNLEAILNSTKDTKVFINI